MELTHSHHHGHEHAHDHTRDWVKTVILLGLALYFAYNLLTGNVTNYINTRFVWLSYVAVILFGALGASNLYAILKHDHGPHHHDDHDHPPISWPVMVIVALPLILGTLIPSKPLGAEAVSGNISLQAASFGTGQMATKDPLQRNVLDWLRVFTQTRVQSSFNGQPADIIGFVYREPNFPENHFMVARFTIACCVADASAI
jgi:putative membrane protein